MGLWRVIVAATVMFHFSFLIYQASQERYAYCVGNFVFDTPLDSTESDFLA